MSTAITSACLLLLLLAILPFAASVEKEEDIQEVRTLESVNSFDVNWSEYVKKTTKSSKSTALSPQASASSTFEWVPSSFGPCFGCGRNSYKHVQYDCVHKLPMMLSMGSFAKALMGVFKVAESECVDRKIIASKPINALGCGPPCNQVRLLAGSFTGCRCDREKGIAYQVPQLTCQDTRNRTVDLSQCKFAYENNVHKYHAVTCNYAWVCATDSAWLTGNWSECTHENAFYQRRTIACAVEPPGKGFFFSMHPSMCQKPKPPVLQLCARWTAERKFVCKCNTRKATRLVLCMRALPGGKRLPVPESECGWHAKPDTSKECSQEQLVECGVSGRRMVV